MATVGVKGLNSDTQMCHCTVAYTVNSMTAGSALVELDGGLIEHGFTSAPTQYRLYGRRVLQV